ncbi:uncharacterized protein RHTO_03954 [Rhodotorula toruloides NP11]|uniref:Uncharacterized protein n=1 Tax=Rhodotorula toruloides (strain NP11) TaxID=1130832 RepID=M7WPW7_RHOT1|nr:uncharacterized protein RHTO_03954 [Rhodotorula toruloides NP11]EMS19910.1 hypothetical protein RHTO_03954 [Rhodotorula toruloides NP11]
MPVESPLLPLLDLITPYLPNSLANPLYTLASLDIQSVYHNPSQLLPLALSALAAYTAFLSFVSTARFAVRTAISLVKWGSIAAVLGAVWMGVNNAGSEKGVSGGVRDAASYAGQFGRGLFSLGQKGAGYYFGAPASSKTRDRRRRSSSRNAAPAGSGRWGDNRDAAAEDFVGNAMKSVLEFINPPAGSTQEKVKRSAKKAMGGSGSSSSGGDGLGGLAWNLAMGRAKKAWDEMTQEASGNEPAGRTSLFAAPSPSSR